MITTGEICTVHANKSTCTVHIPLFDRAWGRTIRLTANICRPPGFINCYKTGDYVWVAFDTNKYDSPVIIGKITQGIETASTEIQEQFICNSLTTNSHATLPLNNTTFTISKSGYNGFSSMQAVADRIISLENRFKDLDGDNVSYGNTYVLGTPAYKGKLSAGAKNSAIYEVIISSVNTTYTSVASTTKFSYKVDKLLKFEGTIKINGKIYNIADKNSGLNVTIDKGTDNKISLSVEAIPAGAAVTSVTVEEMNVVLTYTAK